MNGKMIARQLSRKEQKAYDEWLQEMQETVRPDPMREETETEKKRRVASLLKDFTKFCRYYFEEFMDADFAWFHKKAAKLITENSNIVFVGEWPREHAKSVVMDIFLLLFLKARGELTGVVLASANEDKADGLLADLQEQLMFNRRYIADFGTQYRSGKWDSGHFVTVDGLGFWAFGRGQSPRGVREAANRPNLVIVDDIENLSAYAERGLLRFNRERKQSLDMIEVRRQFLGFPDAPHDDGPDAVESAIYMINKHAIRKPGTIRTVAYKHDNKRRPW